MKTTAQEIRQELKRRGLKTTGTKADLLDRLAAADSERRGTSDAELSSLTVKDLGKRLKELELPTKGKKAELITRIQEYYAGQGEGEEDEDAVALPLKSTKGDAISDEDEDGEEDGEEDGGEEEEEEEEEAVEEEEEEQQQGETPEDEGDEEGDDEEDEEGNEGEEEEEEMDEDAMDALAAKISRSFARRLHPGLELPEGEARPAQQSPWWVAEANGEVAHAKGRSFGAFSKQRRGIVSLKELTQEEGVHGIGSSRQSRDARAKTMGSQGKVDPSAAVDLLGQMNKELVAPRLDGKARVPKANETKESKAVETGAGWYNMASPELTQEIKTDLRILAHRNYLNPKRFYKKEEQKKKLPKHFQIGKIVSGAHEYHNRLTKKQQSKNLVEELNNDSYTKNYLKRKFTEIQSSKDRKGKGKKWSKKKQREKAGKKKLK